ncbi:MAG: helix-turn-helix transcriptional regulator [Cyanobacteria bacterium CRU_2_1]|nr:helix-turn-helix transcriptional regulator [Cyanobacteria bacterium CRU_2_1]
MNTVAYSQSQLIRPIPTSPDRYLTTENIGESSTQNGKLPTLMQGVVESLIDGIMILSDQGELVFANNRAQQICRHLNQSSSRSKAVPQQIWYSCKALIKSRELFPDECVMIEDEIKTDESSTIRIRVRWLNLNHVERPYLLVTLEDQNQSAQYRALAEAHKYGLTDRETEVWMLKRTGHTYKAIAAKLFIAEDTVKKHMKSIYARQKTAELMGE